VTPGWYADPNGGPDLRWWDGTAWSEHTSPPPVAAPAAPAVSPPPAPQTFAPPGQGGSNRSLFIVLGALLAVVVGVGAFVALQGDDDETTATTTTTAADETTTTGGDTTTTTAGPTTAAASEFVTSGGLTFSRLPEPWHDWVTDGRGQIAELEGTAGQYVVVQEQAPSGGQWIGNLLIGDLTSSVPYGGEGDLAAATTALSDLLIAGYYVDDAQAVVVNETAVTIDGHPGYFMHNELTFSQAGLETTREKLIVVVVDTGRARPGVFWASIPYNRADLNSGMDQVYGSLQVND
jgi:hypothetical protein